MGLKPLVWLLGSVVLGGASLGCTVKQPPSPADALAGVLPGTTVVPPEWRATTGTDGAVIAEWLRTFQDTQLEALVDEALRNNLDLIAAVVLLTDDPPSSVPIEIQF